MAHPGLELSAMGAVRPPAGAVLAAAQRREQQGFDAIWWVDHLLHWFPSSIWTPDLVPQAAAQPSPHVWFDPVPVVAAAAGATNDIRLGIGVTDVVRRHPASLAQTALTLDHLTGGRFVLGVGSGEALNLEPFGVANQRPLSRLEEGLEVMRLLMASPDPVDYEGEHFRLRGASLGLRPLGDRPPPVWIAAHRPRGLALAGRRGDGWLPLATEPDEYAGMLARVREAAAAAGREAEVTPGLYARVVVTETREEAEAALDGSLLMRFIALTRPAEAFAARGAEHPLGRGAFGLTSFMPTAYGRAEALRLAESVPPEVVRDAVIYGTPDDVARSIGAFVERGARHVQLTNMTPLAAPAMAAASEALLADTVVALRAVAPAGG
ncbi:MAG TPA: LLM class flavin-dependent oxidoreductase [Miltoncostaeaceae bacterium]|jgi:phthiodiolone/phenolphthiodiolone dimycocerosates ketoreductase|nr:LLM class flavin-dependent oxidoreductase [Miltoncostaeaceae bacterium]